MINNLQVLECFTGLVGWRESAKAPNCYEALTDALKRSDSSVYFNDVPGLNLEIINDTLSKDYADVNTYLEQKYEAAVLQMMNMFVNKQKKEVYTKSLLKNNDIGVYAQNIRTAASKNNRFVGFEIRPTKSNSIRAEVLQFGGAFTQLQDDLPIYFYSSQQLEPIAVYYGDINKTNSTNWFNLTEQSGSGSESEGSTSEPLTFIADYINNSYGHGARYFLGYYEADLDANNYPILTQVPCGTCNASTYGEHKKYVDIMPCEVPSGNIYIGSRELFDIDNVGYSDETHGLYLKVNVTCDITQVICDNKKMFATCLQKQMAINIFWEAYNAPASAFTGNAATKKSDYRTMAAKLELELNGGTIEGRYQKGDLETLTIDFSNIDQVCMNMRKKSFGLLPL